jgi:hypothetical protein
MFKKKGLLNVQKDLSDWKIEEMNGNTTLFYKGKNYIRKKQELWLDIDKMFHDHKTAEHPRELKTYNSIQQH